MTRLLLDFPASQLELALDPGSGPSAVLLAFDQLCLKERLSPVPFIGEEQYDELLRLPGKISRRSPLQAIAKYVRKSAGSTRAMPIAGPNDLEEQWEFALHEELILEEWRNPQIIIRESREDAWEDSMVGQHRRTEAVFRSEDSRKEYRRVVAILESYNAHLYARSDRAPWDLQRIRLPEPGAPKHQQHPCALPIPPALEKVEFQNIRSAAERIRNWEIGGKYYFLPGDDWQPNDIEEAPWRGGRTFRHARCPHCGKEWPIDRKKQIWCWDKTHRHWDVQLIGPEYWSISHDGTLIQKKRKSKKSKKGWRGRRAR
jgi:hypothetical protein